MVDYIFDFEEREYPAVQRPYLYHPGPSGEPPLSPVEMYSLYKMGHSWEREAEREAEKQAAEERDRKSAEIVRKAIEQAMKEASRKAVKC